MIGIVNRQRKWEKFGRILAAIIAQQNRGGYGFKRAENSFVKLFTV